MLGFPPHHHHLRMEVRTQYSSQEEHTALQYKIILLISEGILWNRKQASDMLMAIGHFLLSLNQVSLHSV